MTKIAAITMTFLAVLSGAYIVGEARSSPKPPRPAGVRPALGPGEAIAHTHHASARATAGTHCVRPKKQGVPYCADSIGRLLRPPRLATRPNEQVTLELGQRATSVSSTMGVASSGISPYVREGPRLAVRRQDDRYWTIRLPRSLPVGEAAVLFNVSYRDYVGDPVPFSVALRRVDR